MESKNLLKAAAALAVAASVVTGAAGLSQATDVAPSQATDVTAVQLADAAQMAAVKDRQELMKMIGGNMKLLGEYVKGQGHSPAEAEAAAMKIHELSGKIPDAFKTEADLSQMDAVGKNRAKPEIWLMWDEFVEDSERLGEKSTALASAIKGGDMAAVQTAFGDMGKNACGECHQEFRGPEVK